jgi:hypothetical protein
MRAYYIDLGFKDVRKGSYDNFDFDADGIPRYRYPFGVFYNITFICHYALYYHTLHVKFGRDEDLARFLRVSDWITRHGEDRAGSFVFPYEFPYHGLAARWISALGQGRMLSVLARAYEISGERRHLAAAQGALKPFEAPVAEGGVQARFPDGGIAFEEYPLPKPNLVLNGLITALVGLHDLGDIGGDARARELCANGLLSLRRNLHHYDLGYWSAYDLAGRVPNEDYHRYHVMQLWALFEMTGAAEFKDYARKWQSYPKGLRYHFFRNVSRGRRLVVSATRT